MSQPFLIVGAGGHGRVVADILLATTMEIAGFLDPDRGLWGTSVFGISVLGGDEIADTYGAGTIVLANGIGSVGDTAMRRRVYDSHVARGGTFPAVIHPRAIISPRATIAPGAQIMAGAIIQPGASIGENAIVNTGASIDHDCIVGRHVHIAPGVTLSGGVTIGDGAHIGTGVTVVQRVTIPAGALIKAGSVITRTIDSNSGH